MRNDKMTQVKKGDTLFFNHGAMYPTFEAKIVNMTECGNFAAYFDSEGSDKLIPIEHIKSMGETSANGSPIGVFLLDED